MSGVKRRSGPPRSRSERAHETRLRMTKAAYDLFCERGYAQTTMADVAAAAGVAVQTVYFTFHTKRALLSAAYELAVHGEGEPLPPPMQPWYTKMAGERDIARALRHCVQGIGEILRRSTPLDSAVRASAEGDPDGARVRALHERLRVHGYREMVDILRGKSPLRDGVTTERATQLLLFYVGSDAYRVLVHEYGWEHTEWVDWTVATLAGQVFAGG